jgi:uncharacterized damage-inducible protein DinB
MSEPARTPASAFRRVYEREHATTLKVLQAFPPDEIEFRPHERSNTAARLGWTFVVEELMMIRALRAEPIMGSGFPNPPSTWPEIVSAFDKQSSELLSELDEAQRASLQGAVPFYVAPRQMGEIPLNDFLWFMLHDQIHHRGQFSVYLRMVGGKVPSIYGPTADEPWT